MVYRVYVEKKKELAHEAKALLNEIRSLVGIKELTDVRLYNRYDVENIEKPLFDYAVTTVFSEPQLDIVTYDLPSEYDTIFAVEYLPGQFDNFPRRTSYRSYRKGVLSFRKAYGGADSYYQEICY